MATTQSQTNPPQEQLDQQLRLACVQAAISMRPVSAPGEADIVRIASRFETYVRTGK